MNDFTHLNNHLIEGDCLDVLRSIPNGTLDLVLADPPYFQVKGDFDFGVWPDRGAYLLWCEQWMRECERALKETGTMIVWGGVGEKEMNIARIAIMAEDKNIIRRKNWVTQRNTRGYGIRQRAGAIKCGAGRFSFLCKV